MTYKKLTIFGIKMRKNILTKFRNNIKSYFETIKYDEIFGDIVDNEESLELREKINNNLNIAGQYLLDANISLDAGYSPPGTTSFTEDVNIFFNIFNLSKLNTSYQMVIDIIDQGIGVYEEEKVKAIFRTFNPLWWIWKLVKKIIASPFLILAEAGFNTSKIENSFLGKILKLSMQILIGVVVGYIIFKFGWNK